MHSNARRHWRPISVALAIAVGVPVIAGLSACSSSDPTTMPLYINGIYMCVYEVSPQIECGLGSAEFAKYGNLYGGNYIQAIAPTSFNAYGTDQRDVVWAYLLANRGYYSSGWYGSRYISHTHVTIDWKSYNNSYGSQYKNLPKPPVKPAPKPVAPAPSPAHVNTTASKPPKSNSIANGCAPHAMDYVQHYIAPKPEKTAPKPAPKPSTRPSSKPSPVTHNPAGC